ncbi:MAG: hypothetical protein K8F91_27040, partial [Candidatus Obscuribacterales bacterium]|nr:hypothetical protein [Candidatus Obscuribacterales bacterium]
VESRLGISGLPVEYFGASTFESSARMIEATQRLSALVQSDGDLSETDPNFDQTRFESRSIQFTRALSRWRSETDPERQAELWQSAQLAAARLTESLPNNELGAELAQRMKNRGLIEEIPSQLSEFIESSDFDIAESKAQAQPNSTQGSQSTLSMEPSAILDRAQSQDLLPPGHREFYEQAVESGLLKPADLNRLLNDIDQETRELIITPLLQSGKLTPTGATKLIGLGSTQLENFGSLAGSTTSGASHLDLYLGLLNNPNVDSLAIGQFLMRSPSERMSYENILADPNNLPSTVAINKLLALPSSTAKGLESIAARHRDAVLGLLTRRGPGQLALIGKALNPPLRIDQGSIKAIFGASVDNPDINSDPAKLREADEALARFANVLDSLRPEDAKSLVNRITNGNLSFADVATLSRAAGEGYISDPNRLTQILSEKPANIRAVAALFQQEFSAAPDARLGPEGMLQITNMTNRSRVAASLENNLISPQELHSLVARGPEGFIAVDTILPRDTGPNFSKETIDNYLKAISENRISLSQMESIRQASNANHLTDQALANMLNQPPDVSAKLIDSFNRLWTERSIRHKDMMEPANFQNASKKEREEFTAKVVKDNTDFLDNFVQQLEVNPGDPATLEMAEIRLIQLMATTQPVETMEPALVPSAGDITLDGALSADVPPRVADFVQALANHDYETAIREAMFKIDDHSDNPRAIELNINDLDNAARMEQIVQQMDRIGEAKMTEDTDATNDDNRSGSTAYLASPVIVLPSGTRVDLSGPEIKISSPHSAQDLALVQHIKDHPSFQILRGRVALIAYEERMIHIGQGTGGAKSALALEFQSSPDFKEMEKRWTNQPGRVLEAMREIDVAARFIDAGMSLEDTMRFLGDRHLSGEREFFYNWLRSRGG